MNIKNNTKNVLLQSFWNLLQSMSESVSMQGDVSEPNKKVVRPYSIRCQCQEPCSFRSRWSWRNSRQQVIHFVQLDRDVQSFCFRGMPFRPQLDALATAPSALKSWSANHSHSHQCKIIIIKTVKNNNTCLFQSWPKQWEPLTQTECTSQATSEGTSHKAQMSTARVPSSFGDSTF